MKISKMRTLWIIFISSLQTAVVSSRSVLKAIFGQIDRQWADKELAKWINQLLNNVDVKCKVINPHHVQPQDKQATIIMCNHSSMFDIPLSYKAFPNHSIRMLAKKELSKIPLFGRGMKVAEFPFVDRKNRSQAIKDLNYAKELMESGIVIWLAPEGTRSKDGKVARFKKGGFVMAIQAKATIIPIGIRGAFDILPAKTYRFNTHQTAEVHIGLPVDASAYTMDTKDELIQRVHQDIKRLVGEEDASPTSQ